MIEDHKREGISSGTRKFVEILTGRFIGHDIKFTTSGSGNICQSWQQVRLWGLLHRISLFIAQECTLGMTKTTGDPSVDKDL